MKNILKINGYSALVQYDPEIDMLRGEFIGLNGGADFYAKDIDALKREGALSLQIFLEACVEDGVEPVRHYSGKFLVRVDDEVHKRAAIAAAAEGKSLNQWVCEVIENQTMEFA